MPLSIDIQCVVVRFGPIILFSAAASISFWSVWAYDKFFGDGHYIIEFQQAWQTCRYYAITNAVFFMVMLIGLFCVVIVSKDICDWVL